MTDLRKIPLPGTEHVKLSSQPCMLQSCERADGMFVGLAIVWFGQNYRRRVTFAAAGPTTFKVTKGRRNLPLYLPVCHQSSGAA